MTSSQTIIDNTSIAKIKDMLQNTSTKQPQQQQQQQEQQQQQLQNTFNAMGLPSNKMNSIVANLQSMITCDSDCQKRKKADQLRDKWKAAKDDLVTAPSNVQSTEQTYYVFTEGEVGYRKMLVDRYTKVANKRGASAKQSHHELMHELEILLGNYTAQVSSAKRLRELLQVRVNENTELSRAQDNDIAAVQTNDRRVVYEDWAQDWLHTVKKLFRILYVAIAVVFLYTGTFFQKKGYATITGWLMPVALTAFPFLVYMLVIHIGELYKTVRWYANNKAIKDVYSK